MSNDLELIRTIKKNNELYEELKAKCDKYEAFVLRLTDAETMQELTTDDIKQMAKELLEIKS